MLKVIKSGLYDTVQDPGRRQVQRFGVPYSGVMDQYAAGLANAILGNDADAALLEVTWSGPVLEFQKKTQICITGADLNVRLNERQIKRNSAISVTANDILTFGKLEFGCRAYMAIKHGFKSEVVMNSRSWYYPVTSKGRIQTGDILNYDSYSYSKGLSNAAVKADDTYFYNDIIEVFKGPEFYLMNDSNLELLFNKTFTISNSSNRMAYQLQEFVPNAIPEIITSLVLPGTVQLTPSGQMIILMRDAQVTGGYPRILQLTEPSMNCLSQKIFRQEIRFKCVDM